MVELLLSNGSKFKEDILVYPLNIALRNLDSDMVQFLLSNADKIQRDIISHPLIISVVNKDLEMVKHLVENGAIIQEYEEGHTINIAVKNRYKEIVRFLLDNGAQLQADRLGSHPFNIALMNKDQDMVELLIDIGGTSGFPIDIVVQNKEYETVKILVENGAKITEHHMNTAVNNMDNRTVELLVKKKLQTNHGAVHCIVDETVLISLLGNSNLGEEKRKARLNKLVKTGVSSIPNDNITPEKLKVVENLVKEWNTSIPTV